MEERKKELCGNREKNGEKMADILLIAKQTDWSRLVILKYKE